MHKKKKLPSVPIAYSENNKETRPTLENLLRKVDYNRYKWELCCDLKMVSLLGGIKAGYPKFPCPFCLFDSRADKDHYVKCDWPERETFAVGKYSIEAEPLVPADKFLVPPLHVKLGVMRTFIVTLLKQRPDLLQILKDVFGTSKSEQKLMNGISLRY